MKNGLTVTIDTVAQTLAGINVLATQRVMVGVPSEEADRQQTDDEDRGPINNAELAYIHNNGAPEANIPARPFMEPGISDAQTKIEAGLKAAADAALDGQPDGVARNLSAVGLVAQNSIRRRITTGPFEPLKPATLAARKRRGRTGDKPLIDTAQLRNAITFVIRKVSGR